MRQERGSDMKRKGKGFLIATVVVLVFGLLFLITGEYAAFGGSLIWAGLFYALYRRKQKKPQAEPAAPEQPAAEPCNVQPSTDIPAVNIPADLCGATFGSWDISIHDAEGQDVRFDRAMFQRIDILNYDAAAGVAEIMGTRGRTYETTLDTCTCEDFTRRGLPCKHIYKLALSRGYSPDAFFSARSDVVWYADRCRVYHSAPDCRGLRNRFSRRTTVALAEYQGLHPCKSCHDE